MPNKMVAKSQKQNAENKQKFQNTKLDESFDAFDINQACDYIQDSYLEFRSLYLEQYERTGGNIDIKSLFSYVLRSGNQDISKYPHYSQQNAESKKVCEQEKITATSGKDVLGITKGDKENSYIVHFSDSAMVSRAVARGYVTVNGKEVELTEDTKQQLLKTDKEASAAREKAYQDWLIVSRNSILP